MEKKHKVDNFFWNNREKIKNPLIQGFLSNEANLSLLKEYILDPSYVNKAKVDEAFQIHYNQVRNTKYISNLIHFFSIDFDKRQRKQHEKDLLILDKNISSDSATIIKEIIPNYSQNNIPFENNLLDNVENENLIKSLKKLSDKQLIILDMIYLKRLPLKEISTMLQTTPQNISNHHRKSLKKLNQLLSEEV